MWSQGYLIDDKCRCISSALQTWHRRTCTFRATSDKKKSLFYVTMFMCTIFPFLPLFQKIFLLFTNLMKMNSQLIFPFAGSRRHSYLLSLFHPPSWKGWCSDICPHSKAWVFHHAWKSPSDQKCELLFCLCISTRALQTFGEVTHRADCRQARGRVWQTGKNPDWDAYSERAAWKKAPKT